MPSIQKNLFNVVLTKRDNYSYECEVRLVYWDSALNEGMPVAQWNPLWERFYEPPEELFNEFERKPVPAGHAFPCRLEELIEGVWLSPYSPAWYAETVSRLCHLVGISAHPKSSTLLNPPQR
jgi:hypothetical protein